MDESTSKLQQALLEHTATIQKEALDSAAEHIRSQRRTLVNVKIFAICLTALLVVAMVCATVLGVTAITKQQETIIEQQYALNMQYAGLLDYVSGAEITEYFSDSEENGTAIAGDGNMIIGGDYGG